MTVSQRALREEVGAGLFTRDRVVPLALGLLALLLAFLIVHDVIVPAAPAAAAVQTATVLRGNVRSAVSATGTVVPAQQQSLSFGEAGTLAEIDVRVGDQVTKGQTLARLETTLLQQALTQAQNGLTTAQASYNNTANSNTVAQAQHSLANAQQSLSDTQAQVTLTNQQDQAQLQTDTNQLNTDQTVTLPNAQQALADFNASHTTNCNSTQPPQECTQLNQAITQAQQAIVQDTNKVNQDNNRIATDTLNGQRSINQATNSVTSAQDSLNGQTSQRPNSLASGQASVSNAQLALQTAQRNLDMATLVAPFGGVVQSINGIVGDTVSAGGAATAQAPGTTAPQPSSSGSTSGGGGSGASTAFMVLSDVSGMEVVAPFAETDASRLAPNQQATVTFDAVTNLSLPAHVLAVASTATVVSNVTNYYATLVLDQLDNRLKSGMTANASVTIQSATGVLTLPNSVITRVGGVAFVTLLGRDGRSQTRQQIQTGAVGDTFTEITGGLNEGDKVVRPSLRTPSAAGGPGRGGFGGGGGVRIGGGG